MKKYIIYVISIICFLTFPIVFSSCEDAGDDYSVEGTSGLQGYVFVSGGFIFVANYDGLILFADE